MEACILCGGEGLRLRPLTLAVPKPLLPLGAKPILEVVLSRMRQQGFRKFYLMVNYKADMIRSYFGSGTSLDVKIEYFEEKSKRGTAGPLTALKGIVESPFIVMNADLLTSIRFDDLLKFHKKNDASITVALKRFDRKIEYGVVDIGPDSNVISIDEKPTFSFLINSGIYAVSPEVIDLVPTEGVYPMTELIPNAIKSGKTVLGYEFTKPWRDIGRLDDYMKVITDIENGSESDVDGFTI
jgi:NDP-sugar pyrophosphorylase family protein